MQVVNTLKLSFLLPLVLVIGCGKKIQNELLPTNNRGGYSFEFLSAEKSMSDSLLVTGSIFDIETMQPLVGSSVHFYCLKTKTDNHGHFSFKLSAGLGQDYFFEGVFIGYKTVTTDVIALKRDTLQLNFYLALDTTPIYHCND